MTDCIKTICSTVCILSNCYKCVKINDKDIINKYNRYIEPQQNIYNKLKIELDNLIKLDNLIYGYNNLINKYNIDDNDNLSDIFKKFNTMKDFKMNINDYNTYNCYYLINFLIYLKKEDYNKIKDNEKLFFFFNNDNLTQFYNDKIITTYIFNDKTNLNIKTEYKKYINNKKNT